MGYNGFGTQLQPLLGLGECQILQYLILSTPENSHHVKFKWHHLLNSHHWAIHYAKPFMGIVQLSLFISLLEFGTIVSSFGKLKIVPRNLVTFPKFHNQKAVQLGFELSPLTLEPLLYNH